MKVFLSSDMEGTAGVVDWDQCVGDGPEVAAGRALLLGEVNAAIEGALAGGEETAALIPGVHAAVVKEHVSRIAAHSLHPARACALIRDTAQQAVAGAGAAGPPPVGTAPLEVAVRTTDIAEAASWVRGVERTGPRELRFHGDDPLSVYRSFCAAIMLTRGVAEMV